MKDIHDSNKHHTLRVDLKARSKRRKHIERARKTRIKFERTNIETEPQRTILLPEHHYFGTPTISRMADISPQASRPTRDTMSMLHGPPKKQVNPLIIQERDVAYSFAKEPKLAEMVHSRSQIIQPQASVPLPTRNTALSACILLFGFAVASFLFWNLQGAGRGTAALSTVQKKAASAFEHITHAQTALANSDTLESERQFQAASKELLVAKVEMDAALASSKNILQVLDITGTVKGGQEIIEVGVLLADAGVYMSRAFSPFVSVNENSSLTDAIIESRPFLAQAEKAMSIADEKIAGIATGLMPEQIAQDVEGLRTLIPKAKNTLSHILQESETLLALLGAERDKQYLFLFANSDEIRPVAGFIGTVGLVNMAKGKVENIDVRSVYDGDGQLQKFIAPPNPLLPIVNRWFLRDSNWFIDYQQSARKAAQLFEKEGGPTVDGVIMITPKVIQNLLRVIGPIDVPGYDVTITAENFLEVSQAEVTYDYDRELNKPKQFFSDLTPLLLTKLFSSADKSNTSGGPLQTLHAFTQSLNEKDILLYFTDKSAQEEAVRLGWAGAVPQNAQGFLMVNNANIGGHKSDQFMEQEIDYRTTITENGDADVVLTVRRTHHGPTEKIPYVYPEGEDPSTKDNVIYQRTLVPSGAELIEARGFTPESNVPRPMRYNDTLLLEADPDIVAWQATQQRLPGGTVVGSESGYRFFANWIITKPGQTSVTLYRYRIPKALDMPNLLNVASSYAVSIAKQPGQNRNLVRAEVKLPATVKISASVPDSGVTLESDTNFTYRGQLTSDIVPGIVFEKR